MRRSGLSDDLIRVIPRDTDQGSNRMKGNAPTKPMDRMPKSDRKSEPGPAAPLAARLQTSKASWRRTVVDHVLSALAVVVGLGVFALALLSGPDDAALNAPDQPQYGVHETGNEQTVPPGGPGYCAPGRDRTQAGQILLLAAQDDGAEYVPQLIALQETLGSYFGFEVNLTGAADFGPGTLPDAAGLVVFSNAEFSDPDAVRTALREANVRKIPVAWIGRNGAGFSDELGLSFGPPIRPATQATQLVYNRATVSVARQPMSVRFPVGVDDAERVLGRVQMDDGTFQPAIVVNERRAFVGYVPFDRFNANLSLAAVVDALSYVFGRHERDPQVLLRLEDINGLTYAQGDATFQNTADMLRAERVFMHLAIIPEVVDEDQDLADEKVLANIGAATSVVKLVNEHPDEVALIQHGYRHSRRDPRNQDCQVSGCAFEFFLDDDQTMGPDAAAEFARSRLAAGRELIERHLGPVAAFEAPHYVMSPSQAAVAEQMYSAIMYPVSRHSGTETGYFMPWITRRGSTAYGPSSVGYLAYDDPQSVDRIIENLVEAAEILPDPILVIYYHPFLNTSAERTEDLRTLLRRVRQLGYRFANFCEEVAAR